MDESRIGERRKNIEKFVPYELLYGFFVGTKAILYSIIASYDANAYVVVEVELGKAFDI